MTTDTAKIIAETMDPYQTTEPGHLAYHQFKMGARHQNGKINRGRMSGLATATANPLPTIK